jgi:hypothetical protein
MWSPAFLCPNNHHKIGKQKQYRMVHNIFRHLLDDVNNEPVTRIMRQLVKMLQIDLNMSRYRITIP